jgi:hypothetical protein
MAAKYIRVVARVCCLVGWTLSGAALINWVAMAPIAWIVRDGLGPDTAQTTGLRAVLKFSVGWGVPALVLTALLAGLFVAERRLAPPPAQPGEGD